MTTILGSLTIPRGSAIPTTRPATKLNEFRICLKKPLTQSLKPLSHTPSQKFSSSRRFYVVCEAQNTANLAPAVTDSTWQSLVLESDSPAVLVEFWAPWCGPCRMIHPVIDELAKQYAGKLKVYKVNTDDSPSVANQYGIRSIPTVMIFQNGEKKDTVIGAVPKITLTNCIEKFL